MKVIFVRHGKTKGNLEKRYIGKTDEDLSLEGIKAIKINIDKKLYPPADILFVSPMRRCIQTADLIYPKIKREIINDFRECDFGIFEGKNYIELTSCNEYQKWIDSNGVYLFLKVKVEKVFQIDVEKRLFKPLEIIIMTK